MSDYGHGVGGNSSQKNNENIADKSDELPYQNRVNDVSDGPSTRKPLADRLHHEQNSASPP